MAWRLRFVTAALCCGVAAGIAVHAIRPAPPPTSPVAVAAHALSAGTVLTANDLRVVHVPPASVPDGAAGSVDAFVGRTTITVVPAGLAVVEGQVHDGGPAASAPEGTVVVPVRLDPTVASLLSPGDRVDLLGTDAPSRATDGLDPAGTEATVGGEVYLTRSAIVVLVPEHEEGAILGGGDTSGVVLVAVLPEDAPQIATRGAWEEVSAVFVR